MRSIVLLAALLVGVAACGDSTVGSTVIFGEGEIPAAIPDDFPLPGDAVIGTTVVDGINTKSEFEFRTATALDALTRFFAVQLVEAGYVIDSSTGDLFGWLITFRRDRLVGEIALRAVGAGASQAVVSVNDV